MLELSWRKKLEAVFREAPENYKAIVESVMSIEQREDYGAPDPKRIHELDDGDYQDVGLCD